MAKPSTKAQPKRKSFTTPPFRLSFPFVFEPRRGGEDGTGTLSYSCQAIWTPAKFSPADMKLWKAIKEAMNTACVETFQKPWSKLGGNFKKGLRAVREEGAYSVEKGYGDGSDRKGQAGYEDGAIFAAMSRTAKMGAPGIVFAKRDENGKWIPISEDEGNTDEIYPGCYCRASVSIYTFNKKGNKGVALGLNNLQKLKDGERLDSRIKAEDDFDEDLDEEWIDAGGDDEADDDTGDDDDGDGDDDL